MAPRPLNRVARRRTARADRAGSLACLMLVGGCAPAAPIPTPTPPVAPPSATPTVAFPTLIPTPSWTPPASPTPTLDAQAGLGPLLFQDPFDQASLWDLGLSASGAAELTAGRLNLSVRSPREYHWAIRPSPVAGDFYAEIEVRSQVCSPGDEFGLMARLNPNGEHYRFLISCEGTARITRLLETGSRALTLRQESPLIIPGAPSLNRLAIRVDGLDLTLLVNGQPVVHARDAALTAGSFGLIARAGPDGQVAVGFDNLVVHQLDTRPVATASPSP